MAVLVANPGRPRSTGEIADELHVSAAHLSKVLQQLARAGLARSSAGPSGGFVLSKPPSRIALREVYEAVEGPLAPLECLFGKPVCLGKRCIFGSALEEVDRTLRKWLTNTKLSDVAHVFADQSV